MFYVFKIWKYIGAHSSAQIANEITNRASSLVFEISQISAQDVNCFIMHTLRVSSFYLIIKTKFISQYYYIYAYVKTPCFRIHSNIHSYRILLSGWQFWIPRQQKFLRTYLHTQDRSIETYTDVHISHILVLNANIVITFYPSITNSCPCRTFSHRFQVYNFR